MNVLEALNWRYAVRRFSDERIDDAELQQLLAATRLSASSFGLQPYRLVLVESAQMRRRLLPHSQGQDKVLHCSHLVVFAAQTEVDGRLVDRYLEQFCRVRGVALEQLQGISDHFKGALAVRAPEQNLEWAHRQAYLALGNLLTCAALMGIDSCPMEGIDTRGYDDVLGLAGQGVTTSVICALGRRHPEDDSARQEKVRVDLHEMVRRV